MYGCSSVRRLRASGLLLLAVLIFGFAAAVPVRAAEAFSLAELMQAALRGNPGLQAMRAQEAAAQAGLRTARAYPNPELEVGAGPSRYRQLNEQTGTNWIVGLAQPLEQPSLRRARIRGAEAGIGAADAALQAYQNGLLAQVKASYYEILWRQAQLRMAEDDHALLEQIRNRVKVRVDTGEAPRYELIKADTELLNASKNRQSAMQRVREAQVGLRNLVGPALPEDFTVSGELPLRLIDLPPLASLRQEVLARNPAVAQATLETERARARVDLERRLRTPQVTVKASVEQDPDLQNWRLGLALPLPLWNQRQGAIAEAAANLSQAQALAEQRRLALLRELDAAYSRYENARRQVEIFESGLLRQAEAALKVAEAAYRFGERGILDYLDAQRTFRAVRQDFLTARYELQASLVEIDRLRTADFIGDAQ